MEAAALHAVEARRQRFPRHDLREPIARHNSEFWFAGPGKDNKKADAASWREWMAATNSHVQSFSFIAFREGLYFDNYYVRMLSATGCLAPSRCRAARATSSTTKRRRRRSISAHRRVRGQIRARGRAAQDGRRQLAPVDTLGRLTSRDKRVARAVLEVSARARARASPLFDPRARARPSDSTRC